MSLNPTYTVPAQTRDDIYSEFRYRKDGDPLYKITQGKMGKYDYALYTYCDYLEEDAIGKSSTNPFRLLLLKDKGNDVATVSYQAGPYETCTYESPGIQPGNKLTCTTPKDSCYLHYVCVDKNYRRLGVATNLIGLLGKLEGTKTICAHAMNKASARLLGHSNWKSFPEIEDSYDYRWANTWIKSNVRDIIKPIIEW
jgi:hypothetical protein